MPSDPSITDPTVLAAFISNVITGWLIVDLTVGATLAVVLVVVWASSRTRPAPRHHRGGGRTRFQVPPGARPRPAQHCSRSAAAQTAMLPVITPTLRPTIETAQAMPQVVGR